MSAAGGNILTNIDIVKESIKLLNWDFDLKYLRLRQISQPYKLYDTEDATVIIRDSLQLRSRPLLGAKEIGTIIKHLFNKEIDKAIESTRMRIAFDPSLPDLVTAFINIISPVSSKTDREWYIITLGHHLGNVKKKLNGLDTYNNILLNFYGTAGAGKDITLDKLFAPISFSLIHEAKNGSTLFSDQNENRLWESSFIIYFEELSKIATKDLSSIKAIIDADVVSQRTFHTQTHAKYKHNATLFSSSNTRLRDTILDDQNVRKYAEIDYHNYMDNRQEQIYNQINAFDFLSMWRCINENEPSPLDNSNTFQKFIKWTHSKCAYRSHLSIFFNTLIANYTKSFISNDKIKRGYKSYCDYHNIEQKHRLTKKGVLSAKAQSAGFEINKKGREDGKDCKGWIAPDKDTCRIFNEELEGIDDEDTTSPLLFDGEQEFGGKDE